MTAIPETVSDKAYRKLRDKILNQELMPGAQIPQQRLAKEMGCATSALREALVRLDHEGAINIIPQWGATVWNPDENEIRNYFELREAIEVQTSRLCAIRATDVELVCLIELGIELDKLAAVYPRNPQKVIEIVLPEDVHFHGLIAQYANSPLLERQLERQQILSQLVLIDFSANPDRTLDWGSHENLAKAIATRDVVQAEAAVRTHLAYGLG